jgi:DNA-binding PadR family transcriptional regulator
MGFMSKAKAFSNSHMPLTPPIFYILLALASGERHGYDIMKQVAHDSNNTVRLGAGTLYGAIKRMLEDELIVEVDRAHARRKYYQLTYKGRMIFANELQRYNEAVELARKRSLFGGGIVTEFAI